MTFWKAEPGSHSGSTNVWLTPRYILDALGPFDLDPAACARWKTAASHFIEEDDGLNRDWDGIVWCNPPYGVQTEHWVQRWVNHRNGFLLVAARTDTQWFHDAARAANLIWFPRKRIRFIDPETGQESKSPAFASCIMAAGAEASRRLRKMPGLFLTGGTP